MNSVEMKPRSHFSTSIKTVIAGVLIAVIVATTLFFKRPGENVIDHGLKVADESLADGEKYFRAALQGEPVNKPDIILALAGVCARKGDWSESETLLNSIDLSRCRSDLLISFGERVLRRSNRTELAIKAFESLRNRAGSEKSEALQQLWKVYSSQGKIDEAVSVAVEFLKEQPDNHSLRLELIKLLKGNYREVECLEQVREGLKHAPPPKAKTEFQYLLVDQLIVVGEVSESWGVVDDLKKTDGRSPRLQSKIIDLLRTEGRLNEALEEIAALFPQFQSMPVARLTRGVVYLDLGRFDEAASDLEHVVSQEPFNEGAHFKLSEAYRNLGKDELMQTHRKMGANIREKRVRIIALLRKNSSEDLNRSDCEELSQLNEQLGDDRASKYWKQRAESIGGL